MPVLFNADVPAWQTKKHLVKAAITLEGIYSDFSTMGSTEVRVLVI
jgi:hypothetical protein